MTTGSAKPTMSVTDALNVWVHNRAFAEAGNAELRGVRNELLGSARGHVLEVGARDGANLACYGTGVDTLTVTEWRPAMFGRLARRAKNQARRTTALRAPVEDLPFNDATFDVVVSTFALCRADDQPRSLREIHRVLRPGGSFVFIEHTRAERPRRDTWQDHGRGPRRWLTGCDDDRPIVESIRAAGFQVTDVRRIGVLRLGVARHHLVGVATPIPGGRFTAPHPAAALPNA